MLKIHITLTFYCLRRYMEFCKIIVICPPCIHSRSICADELMQTMCPLCHLSHHHVSCHFEAALMAAQIFKHHDVQSSSLSLRFCIPSTVHSMMLSPWSVRSAGARNHSYHELWLEKVVLRWMTRVAEYASDDYFKKKLFDLCLLALISLFVVLLAHGLLRRYH